MSSSTNKNIGTPVSILDKKFFIACPEHAQGSLRCAATVLDTEMREIRKTGRVIGTDRIAIIAALNIIHELTLKNEAVTHSQKDENAELTTDLQDKLSILTQKIDTALFNHGQLNSDNAVNTIKSFASSSDNSQDTASDHSCDISINTSGDTFSDTSCDSSLNPSFDSSLAPLFEPSLEPAFEQEYAD